MSIIGTIRDAVTGLTASVEARKQTPTGNALNVQIGPGDIISNIPVVMEFGQHQVHEGESYHASDERLTLGTTTVKYGLTVPVYAVTIRAPHLIISVDCYDGAALVRLYEGATFTGGAALTSYNRNRNSATAPGMTITSAVTSTNGTLSAAGRNQRAAGGQKMNGYSSRIPFIGWMSSGRLGQHRPLCNSIGTRTFQYDTNPDYHKRV